MSEVQPISGRMLLQHFIEHGIISEGDRVSRVVIDAPAGGVARMYVERIGDERLLSVIPSLGGVEISSAPVGQAE